jgi:hypothetical protein
MEACFTSRILLMVIRVILYLVLYMKSKFFSAFFIYFSVILISYVNSGYKNNYFKFFFFA